MKLNHKHKIDIVSIVNTIYVYLLQCLPPNCYVLRFFWQIFERNTTKPENTPTMFGRKYRRINEFPLFLKIKNNK